MPAGCIFFSALHQFSSARIFLSAGPHACSAATAMRGSTHVSRYALSYSPLRATLHLLTHTVARSQEHHSFLARLLLRLKPCSQHAVIGKECRWFPCALRISHPFHVVFKGLALPSLAMDCCHIKFWLILVVVTALIAVTALLPNAREPHGVQPLRSWRTPSALASSCVVCTFAQN